MDEQLRKRRAKAMGLGEEQATWDDVHEAQRAAVAELGIAIAWIADWRRIDEFLDEMTRESQALRLGLRGSASWTEIETCEREEEQVRRKFAEALDLDPSASWSEITARLNTLDEATRAEVERRYYSGEFGDYTYFQGGKPQS